MNPLVRLGDDAGARLSTRFRERVSIRENELPKKKRTFWVRSVTGERLPQAFFECPADEGPVSPRIGSLDGATLRFS